MARFCGGCGKPLAPGSKFCGGCGAPASGDTAAFDSIQPGPAITNPPYVAPVKSGSPAIKILLVVALLGGVVVLMVGASAFYFGRKKIVEWRQQHGVASEVVPNSESGGSGKHQVVTSSVDAGSAFPSKEEVGTIIGVPVTSIEFQSKSDASYKTANPYIEATIEIERKSDEADAIQSLEAARLVTRRMAGGKGEKVAGLGDDAVYGAFNVLYVRKNDVMLTITPPNLQQAAQAAQMSSIYAQPMGSETQKKEIEKLGASVKSDPTAVSLGQPDAVSGAVELIRHSATERGNEYETKSRLMARQMAETVLSKIGS